MGGFILLINFSYSSSMSKEQLKSDSEENNEQLFKKKRLKIKNGKNFTQEKTTINLIIQKTPRKDLPIWGKFSETLLKTWLKYQWNITLT